MIRRLIKRILRRSRPTIHSVRRHGIQRQHISSGSLKVVEVLREHGHAAFVVGGAVRDLMLGRVPKDFDVVTDARPEQVKTLFRRAFIVGRRFRIVHVVIRGETIEVSTFRSNATQGEGRVADVETGRLVRDNVFGTQEDDAARRDFSVNALFYDPAKEEIWDYHRGVEDIERRVLRMIGDPATRYREDPVRMLRAVRFAARLDFHIAPGTRKPVADLADLLQHVPPARLFDEMNKLLFSGHSLRAVHQLRAEGLHRGLLPMLDAILEQPFGERFIESALHYVDERILSGETVSPALLFGLLLWHEVVARWQTAEAQGLPPMSALQEGVESVLSGRAQQISIPRRFDTTMKEMWFMQPRFLQQSGSRPMRLANRPDFALGLVLLRLRAEAGEVDKEIFHWWESFAGADPETRVGMLRPDTSARRKRRPRRRRPAGPVAGGDPE